MLRQFWIGMVCTLTTLRSVRAAFEVRVTLHLDNPMYPQHVTTVLSKEPSKQQIAAGAPDASVEAGPLAEPVSEEEVTVAEERHRTILSANMARIENDLPVPMDKKNMDTGVTETVFRKYLGDMPDPAEVGNVTTDTNKSTEEQLKVKTKRNK
jgi:hypothetical protein